MTPIDKLSDFDLFLFYGSSDIDLEIEHDVMKGVLQPKRSLFYFREEGAGAGEYENYPSGFFMQVSLRYDIANWIAQRNTRVSDGSNGYPDRRVATSQAVIKIENLKGEVDIQVLYIPFYSYEKPNVIHLAIGVNK